MPTVAAAGGRRVDHSNADVARFPSSNVEVVRSRLSAKLQANRVEVLVSSAACGADLLALDAANDLGLESLIILPFDMSEFRSRSVTDRPGGETFWGPLFDRLLSPRPRMQLLVLDGSASQPDQAFTAVNERLVSDVLLIAEKTARSPLAIVAWDCVPRPAGTLDLTVHFRAAAEAGGIPVIDVATQ
jgi:hypothetical protein